MSLKAALAGLSAERNTVEFAHPRLNGQSLWIGELTGSERDEWETLLAKKSKDGKVSDVGAVRSKLIQLALCEEDGKQVYAPDELSLINSLPSTFREELFDAAMQFNQLTKEAEEAQLKNSASEAGSDSESASHMSLESRVSSECLA